MAQPALNKTEVEQICEAIDFKIKSIKRASNTATKPQFKELYRIEEATLTSIKTKLITP